MEIPHVSYRSMGLSPAPGWRFPDMLTPTLYQRRGNLSSAAPF
jgi:hypothetical protein